MKKDQPLPIPIRPRRLRRTSGIRRLFSETEVAPSRLIAPLFVVDGLGKPEPIPSLPGHYRFPIPAILREAHRLARRGVGGIAIFPCISQNLRTPDAKEALNPKGLIYRAIRAIKKEFPSLPVFADVALDPYTSHGHDGLLNRTGSDVDNDATVRLLMKQAVLLAGAGADFVAPSDMMDGRIGLIREALDLLNRQTITPSDASYTSMEMFALNRGVPDIGEDLITVETSYRFIAIKDT